MAKSPYARFGTSNLGGQIQAQRQYVVGGADTIQSIAAYYQPSVGYDSEYWRQIAEANGIDDLDAIATGTVLVIPTPLPSTT